MAWGLFIQRLVNHQGYMIDMRPKLNGFKGQSWVFREANEAITSGSSFWTLPFKVWYCPHISVNVYIFVSQSLRVTDGQYSSLNFGGEGTFLKHNLTEFQGVQVTHVAGLGSSAILCACFDAFQRIRLNFRTADISCPDNVWWWFQMKQPVKLPPTQQKSLRTSDNGKREVPGTKLLHKVV